MRQTICKTGLVLLIVQALVSTAVAQASDKSRSDKNRSIASTFAKKSKRNTRQVSSTDSLSRQRRRFWLYASLSSVFDSNIDHDENNVQSFGLIPSLGIHFQNNSERPAFEFDYETALHRYTNTSRWNRMSHKARASYERRFTDFLRSEITGEMSIKGSSEDRELSDQYVLRQEFKIRVSPNRRFNVFGAYRIKRVADDPGRNAIDPYIGASFEQRFAGQRSLELGYRYNKSRSWNPRHRYIRWTYGAEFKTPFLRPDRMLSIEVKYSPQLYARSIKIEDNTGNEHHVTRRDRRWIVDASWLRPVSERFDIGFRYNFEMRRSNDPEKNFNSHLAGVVFTYRWWQ